jgi:uncharacterized protein YbbC (DUF1343 family)
MPGIDRLVSNKGKYNIKDRRAGLITNATGLNSAGRPTVDILAEMTRLTRLFAPEHGIRGSLAAGEKFGGGKDDITGLPVISLYGEQRRPSKDALEGLDILIFDIQDAGARFYTYLYTMAYAMEACAEHNLPMMVLDRPNPVNADTVQGGILNPDFRSFIGYYPIPQRYGLTIGECALMFNQEFGIGCDLTVVPMENYRRAMYFGDTGLFWVLPSPGLPSAESCILYPGTCVFEGTNVSEGRGTAKPFQAIGAPWIDAERLARRMNAMKLPGAFFRPHYFTPSASKHAGEHCKGVEVHCTDRDVFDPVAAGITLLFVIREDYPEFAFLPPGHEGRKPMIDLNTGSGDIRLGKKSLEDILDGYARDSSKFAVLKQEYHIYE